MKQNLIILVGLLAAINLHVRSDEGMWLLPLIEQLNMDTMTKMGLELSAEEIYSVKSSSLKDAIVALDYGSCTAELISPDGLILTNHHCGYDEIQQHSTIAHDYLTDGFWAQTKEDELPNPGKTASFIIKMEDVTNQIHSQLTPNMSDDERNLKMEEIKEQIIENAIEETHYEASVESFFGGNEFYLVVYETYRDVRLVGAPPEAIGKFGHDTDNWMWPRHTCDFSMFRIYSGPDGKPADYAKENIPLKSKHYLPVSLKEIKKGDFAMVLGFPGTTQRYLTSYGVKELLEIEHPNRIKIRGIKQNIILKDMMADDQIRIQYSAKYSQSSNYWKYSIGQKEGLENLKVYERKKKLEEEFTEWIAENPARKEKYGKALELIKSSIEGRSEFQHVNQYLIECFIFGGSEIIEYAFDYILLYNALSNSPDDTASIAELISEIKDVTDAFFKNYSPSTDKKVTSALLQLYLEDVPEDYHPDFFKEIEKKYKGEIDKYVEKLFSKSFFIDKEKVLVFLDNLEISDLEDDMAFRATLDIYYTYLEIYLLSLGLEDNLAKGEKLFIAGLQEMKQDKTFYPDANSTLRLTYGTVSNYSPRDAVTYKHFTTMKGIMEKEDPDNWEFIVPEQLKELYRKKDFGRYGEDDYMPVCFTTNNDITGGNSGSPVINGKGELIGLAFDGNWEAMSGDVVFENKIQKCINVDIRYVLFIIDKFAGATHLIKEMNIIE